MLNHFYTFKLGSIFEIIPQNNKTSTMKKMITAVAAILISVATFAQSAAHKESPAPATKSPAAQQRKQVSPEDRAKRETEQINSYVPLGAAYDKVLAVNLEYTNKMIALKASLPKEPTEAQKADMQSQRKTLNESRKKDTEVAMGKELYAKYQAARKEERKERKETKEMHEQQSAPVEKK
jgi:hypothetical protein